MNKLKPFVLAVLLLVIFQFNLFSLITSRIKGIVKDKDTGQPIQHVKVSLYMYIFAEDKNNSRITKTYTNSSGMFIFDNLKENKYFVQCEHEQYIVSPPRPLYGFRDLSTFFDLEEGQIKYLIISLERGGMIRGKILRKDIDGTSGLDNVTVFIDNSDTQVIESMYIEGGLTDQDGNYWGGGLSPGDSYRIYVSVPGFPIFRTFVSVKKGETTILNHTFDATDNTGVYGIISKNGENLINTEGNVYLYRTSDDKMISSFSIFNTEGRYVFKNIPPGYYNISFSYTDENEIFHRKLMTIEIRKNVMKEINVNF